MSYVLALLLVFTVTYFQLIQIQKLKRRDLFLIFILHLSLKIVAVIGSQVGILSLVDSGKDTLAFDYYATKYAINYSYSSLFYELFDAQKVGSYGVLVGIIYKIFGANPILPIAINFLLINYVILKLINLYSFKKIKSLRYIILLILIATNPNLMSYGCILLREAILIASIGKVSFDLYYLINDKIKVHYLTLLINVLAQILLHSGLFVISFLSIFIIIIKQNNIKTRLLLLSSVIVLIVGIITFSYGGGYFNKILKGESNIDSYLMNRLNSHRIHNITKYDKYYELDIANDILIALPIDYANFLLRPIIINPESIITSGASRYVTSITYYYIILLLPGLLIKGRFLSILWAIYIFISIGPFVMGSGDVFQALRHKIKFIIPFILILFHNKNEQK